MKAEVIIKPYRCLPCELEIFTINGIKALVKDFGDTEISGECMDDTCGCEFIPYEITQKTLDKYNIDSNDYDEICKVLEETLYVTGCGWCS